LPICDTAPFIFGRNLLYQQFPQLKDRHHATMPP
jgi:hypothetical protein